MGRLQVPNQKGKNRKIKCIGIPEARAEHRMALFVVVVVIVNAIAVKQICSYFCGRI